MSDEPVGLAEAIRRLRAELVAARSEGEGQDLRFRLGEVQLEFQVEVTREGSGEAGIRFWVVSVGGKAGMSSTGTHTVSLSLVPQAKVGSGWQDVMVAGEVVERPPLPGSNPR